MTGKVCWTFFECKNRIEHFLHGISTKTVNDSKILGIGYWDICAEDSNCFWRNSAYSSSYPVIKAGMDWFLIYCLKHFFNFLLSIWLQTVKVTLKNEANGQKSKSNRQKRSKLQLAKQRIMPEVGDFCFAHVRGYSEWPAVVTGIKTPSQVWVKFFNSSEM